ncbi:hypothetical protein V8E36_009970, partial [Tilletia maclaganii]
MRMCNFSICTLACHFLTCTLTVAMRRVPFRWSTLLRHFPRFIHFSHDSHHATLRSNRPALSSPTLLWLISIHFDNHHFPHL